MIEVRYGGMLVFGFGKGMVVILYYGVEDLRVVGFFLGSMGFV